MRTFECVCIHNVRVVLFIIPQNTFKISLSRPTNYKSIKSTSIIILNYKTLLYTTSYGQACKSAMSNADFFFFKKEVLNIHLHNKNIHISFPAQRILCDKFSLHSYSSFPVPNVVEQTECFPYASLSFLLNCRIPEYLQINYKLKIGFHHKIYFMRKNTVSRFVS